MDLNQTTPDCNDKISYFDQLFCSDHIRMLKIFLHYVPASYRKMLTVYIKFLELQQAMYHPCRHISNHSSDVSSLISELLPYCTPAERQQFQNMESMFTNIEQIKSMMEMMDMMKDMFGDEESGFNPEMLAGMMDFMK